MGGTLPLTSALTAAKGSRRNCPPRSHGTALSHRHRQSGWSGDRRRRPWSAHFEGQVEAAIGIEPMYRGFADLCLTAWLRRRNREG